MDDEERRESDIGSTSSEDEIDPIGQQVPANRNEKTRKRRKLQGKILSFLVHLANASPDELCFPGDATIRGYSGPFKDFLIALQLNLRAYIAIDNAFPKSIEFEKIIRKMFDFKARQAYEAQGELSRRFILPYIFADSVQVLKNRSCFLAQWCSYVFSLSSFE